MKLDDLNIGDRVRIASWADMLEETRQYGGREEDGDSIYIAQDQCYFVDAMSHLIGNEFTVVDMVYYDSQGLTRIILVDDGGEQPTGWTITAGMLELVPESEMKEIAVQDLLSIITQEGD